MWADLATHLQIEPWPPAPDLALGLALALVAGGLVGELVFRVLRLPRAVGYGAVGLLAATLDRGLWAAAPGLAGLPLHGSLRLLVDLALGLLLFELGARVHLRWLRANPGLLATSVLESLLSFAAVAAALVALGCTLPVALSCAALGVSASAAVVSQVCTDLRSAGQVTERMLVLTALNTLAAVLLHKAVSGALHLDAATSGVLPWDAGWVRHWMLGLAQPLWTLLGSLLLAAVLARALTLAARWLDPRQENAVLLLLGLILGAVGAARALGWSTLLVPLLAGVLLRHASPRPWVWPRHFGTAGGVLVLALFIIVGASALPALAADPARWAPGGSVVLALALLGARGLAKAAGVIGLARWSGITLRQGAALSLSLTPLSATTLVLLTDLQASHPALAAEVTPIVLGAVALMAVLGPVAVQAGLRLGGELQTGSAPAPVPAPKGA